MKLSEVSAIDLKAKMFSLFFGDSEKTTSSKKGRLELDLLDKIEKLTKDNIDNDQIISELTQGVLIVDENEVVQRVNPAASTMLSLQGSQLSGKTLVEVIRIHQLQQFIRGCLRDKSSGHCEINFDAEEGERLLQVYGKILHSESEDISLLVAINDISHIRRLENLRKEFVANVSHELKTPITAIQGFVETLLEGAMADPENNQRFLTIISKHAERLSSIIESLLSLSKIEQEKEHGEISLEADYVYKPLTMAIQTCEMVAKDKEITLSLKCDENIIGYFDLGLLEQAVINLIKNAIEYSPHGGQILVEVKSEEQRIFINVTDFGCGIESVHLPRLFERFYRVDKARSRKDGGSGLGLAIVKHIAQAHGGFAGVESVVGKGSTFYLMIKGKK